MKKIPLLLIALFMCSFTVKEPVSAPPRDKQDLLDYFQETGNHLLKSIDGLNNQQMQFKPAEDKWSINQCLEHIILTEKLLFGMAKKVIEQPANPERKKEIKTTDEEIISMMTDRSKKAQAPEAAVPGDTYASTSEAVAAFKEHRKVLTEYIRSTPENLRDHVTDSPMGPVDAYQFLLFTAAHCSRHTLQIEEVKVQPAYPSSD
ncbi:DinB family protein [Anseongella ginsenosidimutans]|uniref:DinB family protein n=1 Tax=Anseongella ginsenosidimutans TaxID=496056 RepID=A0A4R3KSR5_9SPHI|nr:DinB family protein [Anseongella ginsenosidimutans]QEC53374.1 DinB family protein [Anseongella ginsenosidimutans]TCS88258.1 DinB family protein [Anseongella ginsenosidimutans]